MILAFKTRFVPSVADGTKPHTIRAGKRWREGQSIQFYENARQPGMRKFRPDDVARVVQDITIEPYKIRLGAPGTQPAILVDGRQLTPLECQELARRDGFQDFAELVEWFDNTHGLPFTGQLIGWTDLRY